MLSLSPGIIRTGISDSFHQRGVVGAVKPLRRGFLVGGKDDRPAKGLRCLSQPQPFPRDRFFHPPLGGHLLHGILYRYADGDGAELSCGCNRPTDEIPGDERSDRVMDDDDPVFVAHMLQGDCAPNPASPLRPGRIRPTLERPYFSTMSLPDFRNVPLGNGEEDLIDNRRALKRLQGVDEYRDTPARGRYCFGIPVSHPSPRSPRRE